MKRRSTLPKKLVDRVEANGRSLSSYSRKGKVPSKYPRPRRRPAPAEPR